MSGSTRLARALAILPLFLVFSWVAGCGGGKGKTEMVNGKVTIDGKAVSGEITFLFADGKESKAPLASDGGYQILNPPKGEAKIGIKSYSKGIAAPAGKGGSELPGMASAGGGGVPPPAKYANPASSGLTYTIKGGQETYDIPLPP